MNEVIFYLMGMITGVPLYVIVKYIVEEYQSRQYWKRTETKDASYREKRVQEMKEDLDGWLAWAVTGGVTREDMIFYLDNLIWGDDRENLSHLIYFMRRHLGGGVPLEDMVTLDHVDERKFDDGTVFEISLNMAILESHMPDVEKRRKMGSRIEGELHEYIHDAYGDHGEMELKVGFFFVVPEDDVL